MKEERRLAQGLKARPKGFGSARWAESPARSQLLQSPSSYVLTSQTPGDTAIQDCGEGWQMTPPIHIASTQVFKLGQEDTA